MPGPFMGAAFAAAALSAIVGFFNSGTTFVPGACDRLEPYISSHLVGQGLAVSQLTDAVCDHIASPSKTRPLVLSLHGPPGVGKSMVHLLTAQALYSKHPSPALACPGHDCAGYKVLYGMDYVSSERAHQQSILRSSILAHVRAAPESLIVIEEYDKLDCSMRGFFRQFLETGRTGNVTLNRAIILLESNLGFVQLHRLLKEAGRREAIPAEDAQRALKDLIFDRWIAQGCEERTDTIKMVSLVDMFLPFFPLERAHIRDLFARGLGERSAELEAARVGRLGWDPQLVDALTARVEFDGAYPIEGAKEVAIVLTKYISRAVRTFAAAQRGAGAPEKGTSVDGQPTCHLVHTVSDRGVLSVTCAA